MIAVQIFEKMETEIPNLREKISKGEFTELREWLRTHIHEIGKLNKA